VAAHAAGIPGLSAARQRAGEPLRPDARLLPLVLASASPRRAALLAAAGLEFERAAADVDERPLPGESPADTCLRLACAKARTAAAGRRHGTLLAGDTLVAIDGEALGKPAGAALALAMLRRLQGREHEVFSSAAALRARDGRLACGVARSRVRLAPLDEAALAAYVSSGEWEGKAGAYAIQGRAGAFAQVVEGRVDTVVGLSVELVARLLDQLAEDA
jgi:septum formation protein